MAPETRTQAPPRQLVTVTFASGETEQYDLSPPSVLYAVNRLGVSGDEIDASFFMMWVAAGKPGLNGHDLTIDNARPALEAWLDTIPTPPVFSDQEQGGPPTKQPKRSRGSAE